MAEKKNKSGAPQTAAVRGAADAAKKTKKQSRGTREKKGSASLLEFYAAKAKKIRKKKGINKTRQRKVRERMKKR